MPLNTTSNASVMKLLHNQLRTCRTLCYEISILKSKGCADYIDGRKNKMMTRYLEIVADPGLEPKISDYYFSAPVQYQIPSFRISLNSNLAATLCLRSSCS